METNPEPSSPPKGSKPNQPMMTCQPKKIGAMRYGELCPYCSVGIVEYDSQLNLVCQHCGKIQTGAFT